VLFQYNEDTSAAEKAEIAAAFLALKDACRLKDGKKYILDIDGGVNHSPEDAGQGTEVSIPCKCPLCLPAPSTLLL
jgi:hypothetical protein